MSSSDQQLTPTEASSESIQQALNQLLHQIAPALSQKSKSMTADPICRIQHCIKLIKTEASIAASLIADCAPQGRPMLAQAQQTLKSLESLQTLARAATKESLACRFQTEYSIFFTQILSQNLKQNLE